MGQVEFVNCKYECAPEPCATCGKAFDKNTFYFVGRNEWLNDEYQCFCSCECIDAFAVKNNLDYDPNYRDFTKKKELPVLEHGYVHLIAVDGDEQRIADMASISRGNMKGELSLVQKLVEWGHWTPFEFARMVFRIKAPVYIARQWMRHRTGAFVEKSMRYCEINPIECDGIDESAAQKLSQLYNDYICMGASPEGARNILPLGVYTVFNWTVDIRNLIHFLELRTASGAQLEMQKYAKAVMKFFEVNFPETFKSWSAKNALENKK